MTPKEKQKEIVKAIEQGVPKQRINPEKRGRVASKLVGGEKIPQEEIERMYQNLIEYRKNPNKYKALNESYRHHMPEIPRENKIEQIIQAVESGVAKRHLDPFGDGDAVRNLLRGETVGEGKVNEMYARFLNLREKKATIEPQIPPSFLSGGISSIEDLANKIHEQNREIETLNSKLASLQKQVTELTEENKAKERPKKQTIKVLGMSVVEKTDIIRGKKYKRWYATFRENGKQRWIYIGVDISNAREKIRNYLEKKEEEGKCKT